MSTLASDRGFELVWVNASPTGPIERTRHDPRDYSATRIPLGKSKTISRSPAETTAAPVNDLGDSIYFPGAKVVSREHAVFEWQDGFLIVKDLGSTHGTFVARRQAKFSESDVITETAPLAGKKRVEGILTVQDGDLIEFGRECRRSDNVYHPVRCYLRVARQPDPTPSIAPFARSGAISVPDDVLDSDSDIVSITGDAFNRIQVPAFTGGLSFHKGIDATVAPVTPTPMAETLREVVDLTSDDEAIGASDGDGTFDSEVSEDEHAYDSDAAASEGHDGLGEEFFDDDTDSGSDIDDPFDFSTVPWRHEIHEVACEQEELRREALDARSQGEAYMAGYKTAQTPDSPATSVEADSPLLGAAKERSLSPLASLSTQVESSEVEASAPHDAAFALEEPDNADHPGQVAPVFSSPQKRKLDTEEITDATVERAQTLTATVSAAVAPPTCGESPGTSTVVPAITSLATSPSKKMRFSDDKAQDDAAPADRAPSRARKIRTIAAKTIQVTSLLSAGFLAGSLFTFKSLMNAAAAANAAGHGK
ncbi:hypothetical protein EX895_000731 [Sporisorium graminicola]|uniref:FHA domain-containing protein n=1 Tax=Sporisorium graminicola TaxID=280036 RepID=A0A4U7L0S1_9BASI|nr:hypothetical protein EX895_000731 [Sporisorium graminicola]TKY90733.1 hypothetical protein EX895_000731 [Sporisorium graminicola]